MISPRPYRREPLTIVEAKTELQRSAGSQLDPDVVKAFLCVLEEQENQQGPLEEVKAPGTSDQSGPTIPVPTGNVWQSVAEMRKRMAEMRERMAEMQQQQLALQQRIEASQHYQHYLAWRKQERERQRQELFTEARSKQ